MNPKTVGQLQMVVEARDADALCDWIREQFEREPVCREQPGRIRVVVDVYFDTVADARHHKRRLPDDFGISAAEVMPCHEQQWTTFWRHHFHVTDIGRRLRTVPVWETPPDDRRINLLIDPGLSFGTGDHFTTRFCLEELERACTPKPPRSMLDAGTGSGILAIAAVQLGVKQVDAFDYDPQCVQKAQENAALNGLPPERIPFYQADVLDSGWLRSPADVVCANILTTILIQAAPALWAATKKRLILTGIREVEGDSVADAFIRLGGREITRDGNGEWCGIVIDRAAAE